MTYQAIDFSKNINIGEIKSYKIGNISFLIWRKSDNHLVAQSKYCTHLGALLTKGKIENDKLICPFHGFNFDENGQSNRCIPKIKNYKIKEKFGFIWVNLGEKENEIGNFVLEKINFGEYDIIECFKKEYDLPSSLVASNFFDLNHFEYIHGVKIKNFDLLEKDRYLHYKAIGEYEPYFKFQKLLFKFLPNIVENEVFYKDNFMFSRHSILNKKGKVLFEYYGLYPTTSLGKNKTLVISSIMVKKGFLSLVTKIYGKKVLFKATNDEFKMLEGGNYNIKNFVKGDELLHIFLNFYKKEQGLSITQT